MPYPNVDRIKSGNVVRLQIENFLFLCYNENMTKILAKNKIFLQKKRSLPLAWKKAAGMWKNKKLDPILYLKKIRKEW
jgi:hypothetical protein